MNDQPRNLAVVEPAIDSEMAVWQMMRQQAEIFLKGGLIPSSVKSPEAAISIMVLGRELGFDRMQSFRLIDVIQGRPTLNAGGMAAMVQKHCLAHGGYLRVVESTDERATVEFKRADWPDAHRFTFSMDDAKRANLTGKETWKQYPKNMLYARAVANACRMGFADVVAGLYDPDELTPPPFQRAVSGNGAPPLDDPNVIDAVSNDQSEGAAMRRLHAIGKDRNLDHDLIRDVAHFHYPAVQSLKDCTVDQLRSLAGLIESASDDDLYAWTETWEELIGAARSAEELAEIGATMANRGISSKTHQHLLGAYNRRKIDLAKEKAAAQPSFAETADNRAYADAASA